MATSFKFYTDAALTTEFTPGVDWLGPVTSPPQDFVLYLGSTVSANKVEASSDPGIDQITISITDTDPGNNLEATDIKLATTNGGLTGATGGASLDLGTVINGGSANAAEVHIRVAFAAGGIVTDQTCGIESNTLVESVI